MHEHLFTKTISETRIPTSKEIVSVTFGCECGETVEVTPGSKLYTELKASHGKRIKSEAAIERANAKKQGRSGGDVRKDN